MPKENLVIRTSPSNKRLGNKPGHKNRSVYFKRSPLGGPSSSQSRQGKGNLL